VTGFVSVTSGDFAAISFEIVLACAGMLIILLDAFARGTRPSFPYLTLAALAAANFFSHYTPGPAFSGSIEVSELTRFVELLSVGAAALAVLGGSGLLRADKKDQGELYALLLWTASGLTLMVKGNDLLVVFIGLELMSLGLYVLATWYRDVPASTEAGMKYFLMGALSSAFLLFGVATLYGRLGSTNLTKLRDVSLASPALLLDPMVVVALLMIIAALGFKLALVPFHAWAPDVYQGMTTPGVAFLSTAPKAGAAIVLMRILVSVAPAGLGMTWQGVLSLLAALSILFGNVVGLAQRDVKRMLAYSGIAQMGYAAIGLATFNGAALEGLLVFLAGYLITNAAAFLAVAALSNGEREPHLLADLAGLGRRNPLPATVLTLAMISLAGVPPTVGFIGKLLVFKAAVEANLVSLAIIGVLGSLISVGYYLRVVYMLWMKEPSREVSTPAEDVMSGAAYFLTSAGMLVLGVLPGPLLELARAAAEALPLK